jgi:hypothetical protein
MIQKTEVVPKICIAFNATGNLSFGIMQVFLWISRTEDTSHPYGVRPLLVTVLLFWAALRYGAIESHCSR